jgi:hypothetical protein
MNQQDSEAVGKQVSEELPVPVSARRRLFQVLAAGTAASVVLPEKWVKPVVDAVIVPAHAAGSINGIQGTFGNLGLTVTENRKGNVLERLTGLLIGSAYAAPAPLCGLASPNNGCISFTIPPLPSTTVSVFAWGNSNTATIYPNNSISSVMVGALSFANLVATSVAVSGIVGQPNCASESFSFPRVSAACGGSG